MKEKQNYIEEENAHQQFIAEVDAFIAQIDREMCKIDQRYLVDLILDNPFVSN